MLQADLFHNFIFWFSFTFYTQTLEEQNFQPGVEKDFPFLMQSGNCL